MGLTVGCWLHHTDQSLPGIGILNLLERYRYLPSALRWQEIRETRNQIITHGYRLDPDEWIVTLEIAFGMVSEMSEIVAVLKKQRRH